MRRCNNLFFCIWYILLILTSIPLFAENDAKDIPKIIPESPNTASLGIYGQIPVGHYTGVPNISIPIYSIEIDGNSLPINLSYHASGIKVAQEASWVGLGWSLQAGGCITHEMKGYNDLPGIGKVGETGFLSIADQYYPEYSIDRDGKYYSYWPTGIEHLWGDYNLYNSYNRFNSDLKFDSEPDIFHFNFAGHNVSAFFDRKALHHISGGFISPIIRNQKEYLDIRYHVEDKRWIVKDAQGFTYYFSSTEVTTAQYGKKPHCSYIIDYLGDPYEGQGEEISTISAWYLDSIVSPQHNTVTFLYETDHISTLAQRNESAYAQKNQGPLYPERFDHSSPPYAAKFIHEWEDVNSISCSFSNAEIKQLRLSKISYDDLEIRFTTKERLDLRKHGVKYNETLVTPMNAALSDIIIGNNQNGNFTLGKMYSFNYSYFGQESDFRKCRLKLESVGQKTGSNIINTYKFTYNDKVILPQKNSNKVDFWGYYNGQTLTGCWEGGSNSDTFLPHINSIGIGRSGANKQPDHNAIQAGILTSIKYPTGGETHFEYSSHMYSNKGSFIMTGGGLRVSRIYDLVDDITYNERRYDYYGGILMNRIMEYCGIEVDYGSDILNSNSIPPHLIFKYQESNTGLLYTMSSAIIPQSTDAAGSVVGYSTVDEILINNEGDETEKIQYNFHNNQSRLSENIDPEEENNALAYDWFYIPGFPTVPNLSNGLPKSIRYFNEGSDSPYKTIEYSYQKDPSVNSLVRGFKTFRPNFTENVVFVRYYPLRSEWWKLNSVETTETSNGVSMITKENYTYDTTYKLIRKTDKTVSTGDIYSTEYVYPFDLSGGVYPQMVQRSMLSHPIEVVNYKNNKIISSKLTTYKLMNNYYMPHKVYELETANPLSSFTKYNGTTQSNMYETTPTLEISRYDNKGNIIEYRTKDNKVYSFLWAYNNKYPIAQIENISYAQLEQFVGTSTINSLSNSYNPNIDLNSLLAQSITQDFFITTYKYQPFVGITSITDPRGVTTQYFYDNFGRLIYTKDHNNHILNYFKYHTYDQD